MLFSSNSIACLNSVKLFSQYGTCCQALAAKSIISDANTMVQLILFCQTTQNRYRIFLARLIDVHLLKTLQWLPTGAVARAIERASGGEWLAALVWLLYSAAAALACVHRGYPPLAFP